MKVAAILILIFQSLVLIHSQLLSFNTTTLISLSQTSNSSYKYSAKIMATGSSLKQLIIFQLRSYKAEQYYEITINVSKSGIGSITLCKGIRHISCAVDPSLLVMNQQIDLQIQSNFQGQYQLIPYLDQAVQLNEGQFDINFLEYGGKHYIISLPSQFKTPQSLQIFLTPNNRQSYCRISAKLSLTYKTSFQSINMWQGTQGLFLSKLDYTDRNQLFISVIGQIGEKYTLKYNKIIKDHKDLQIPIKLDEFVQKNDQKKYHIKLNNSFHKQQLIINFQIYSGNPQINFYTDFKMNQSLKKKYFQYMADSKFTFTQQQLQGKKDLYFKIRSNQHKSILKIITKIVKPQLAQMLQQNSFNFYSVGQQNKYLYFYVNPAQNGQKFINISISAMNIFGNALIGIMLGKSQKLECLPQCYYTQFKIIEYSSTTSTLKSIYEIQLEAKILSQSSIILLKLQKSKSKVKKVDQLAIQYNFAGKIINLRQNYPLIQLVDMQKTKYYKYTPLQTTKLIKICASLISGDIGMLGFYSNPNLPHQTPITASKDCIQFNSSKIKKTIYISIHGVQKSKYSLSIQTGHKQQVIIIPTLETNQDIEYQVTITPLGSYIFVLHPIYAHLKVFYNASHPMKICFLKQHQTDICDDQYTRNSEVVGLFYNRLSTAKSKSISVYNPSLSTNLNLRLKYHSGDYEHCQLKLLNKVYEEDITSNSCYQYELPKNIQQNYQIITKSLHYRPQKLTIGLCSKQVLKFTNQKIIKITKQQIQSQCKNQSQFKLQLIIEFDNKVQSSYKIQYIVQSISQLIRLPLNLRFTDHTIIPEQGPIRYYAFQSQQSDNIIVTIKQSSSQIMLRTKFYASKQNKFSIQKSTQLMVPFMQKNMQESLEIDVILFSTSKMCENLNKNVGSQCQIIILLQPIQVKNVGKQFEYSIQLKTTTRQLKQYQPETQQINQPNQSVTYLFYPYLQQLRSTPYVGLVHLSTHNEPCARIYVNRFEQINKAAALVNSIEPTNIFPIDVSAYVIQVQSNVGKCKFTIQVTMVENSQLQSKGNIRFGVLHEGSGVDIQVQKDQVKYFIVDISKSQFQWRVLYLRNFGDVRIYAVVWSEEAETKILKNEQYKFLQTDFSLMWQFPNEIEFPFNKKQTYIIAIQAETNSQGTLLLHNSYQPIILPHTKKVLITQFPHNTTIFKYYTPRIQLKSGQFHLHLIYGNVKIKAYFIGYNKEKNEIQINNCCASGQDNVVKFEFKQNNKLLQYLQIEVQNQQKNEAIYQISVELDVNQISTQDINKSILNHIQLSKQRKTILKTKIISKIQQIIISTSHSNIPSINPFFNQSNITSSISKINQTLNQPSLPKIQNPIPNILHCLEIKIVQNYIPNFKILNSTVVMDNVLIIYVQLLKEIRKLYFQEELLLEVSIKSYCPLQQFPISITTNLYGQLTILSPFKWNYFRKENNFAVASDQEFLIDLISCLGPSTLLLAESYQSLHNQTQNFRKVTKLANQHHVYKVIPSQSVSYLKLTSSSATIRLIKPDLKKQIGVGYYKYEWDYFLYETDFQKLTIYLQPLRKIGQTKTKIIQILFLVRVIGNISMQHSSAQCDNINGSINAYWKMFPSQKNQVTKILISKQQLLKSLNENAENLYIIADLLLTLQTPLGTQQTYKFLSSPQQLPTDIFNITRLSNKIIAFGIVMILGVIFGCVGLAQCFLKYIVPILGRISKNNELIEQDQNAIQHQMQNLPVSSDRNTRVSTQLEQQRAVPKTTTEQQIKS